MTLMGVLSQATSAEAPSLTEKAGKRKQKDDCEAAGFDALLAGLIPAVMKGLDSGCTTSQNNIPAGKDANSGGIQGALQSKGVWEIAQAGPNNLEQGTAAAGMPADVPQNNSELDHYKQKIADLLKNLSGQIEIVPSDQSLEQRVTGRDARFTVETVNRLAAEWQTGKSKQDEKNANPRNDKGKTIGIPGSVNKNEQGEQPIKPGGDVSGTLSANLQMQTASDTDAVLQPKKPAVEISGVGQQASGGEGIPVAQAAPALRGISGGSQEIPAQRDQEGLAANTFAGEMTEKSVAKMENKTSTDSAGNDSGMLKDSKDKLHAHAAALNKDQIDSGTNQGLSSGQFNVIPDGTENAVKGLSAKIDSSSLLEQIVAAFPKQTTERHSEIKNLDIRLHPAELGNIRIAMRWEDGQIHLQVQATEAATGNLIQNHLADLRQSLQNNGISCGLLQMQMNLGNGQQNFGQNRQTFLEPMKSNRENEAEVQPGHLAAAGLDDGPGRLNVTA